MPGMSSGGASGGGRVRDMVTERVPKIGGTPARLERDAWGISSSMSLAYKCGDITRVFSHSAL